MVVLWAQEEKREQEGEIGSQDLYLWRSSCGCTGMSVSFQLNSIQTALISYVHSGLLQNCIQRQMSNQNSATSGFSFSYPVEVSRALL